MFQFIGYNFFSDKDALNPAPSMVDNITTTRLTNAVFDHFNITKNTDTPYGADKPSGWDYDTVLNANLDGNISAGNIDFIVEEISAIKIKRRVKGTFNWVTIKVIPVNKIEDLNFLFTDRLNASGVEYEYALVPMINDAEGNYIINSILSKIDGLFLVDADTIYKFYYAVNYGGNQRNQQIGTFQPLGSKYPVIITNGNLNYDSGNVTAMILPDDYEDKRNIDRLAITKKKDNLKKFLTDHRAKILKDWNGNIWLVMIVDNPQFTYKSGYGMGLPTVAFNWAEIGDANNQMDLYLNGIIEGI